MARDFSGTTPDCLTIGNLAHLNITGTALTIHAFVQPDDAAGASQFILSKDATSDRAYVLAVGAGGIQTLVGDGGTGQDLLQGNSTLSNGVWYSVGMVKDGTGANALRAYLNGVEDGTLTSNIVIGVSNAIASIGSRAGAAGFFNGRIAEVSIFASSLTAGNMASLAAYASPLSLGADLRGYWPVCGVQSPEMDLGRSSPASIAGAVPAAQHPFTNNYCDPAPLPHIGGRGAA